MNEFRARISRVRVKGGADVRVIAPKANDIPAALRRFATEIERGDFADVNSLVVVSEGDEIAVHGFGNIDGLRSIAVLGLGQQYLSGIVLDEINGEAA